MKDFKNLLKSSGIKQTKLAEFLGVTQQCVSLWCKNKREPKISQLKPLSQLLNVDLGTLVECFSQNEIKERRA